MADDRRQTCDNCGELAGPSYCGRCGQEIDARRRPLVGLLTEAASEWLALDSKLLRTLGLLARPGRLTDAYLAGQRARYLRPVRLYFVASLLLFSSVLAFDPPDASKADIYVGGELVARSSETENANRTQFTLLNDGFLLRQFRRYAPERLELLREMPPQELVDAVVSGMRRTLPAALILFLPFLALALKLLYRRSGLLYVDHLVFAVHYQSALFIALAATWLVGQVAGLATIVRLFSYVATVLLVPVLYLPPALHRVYRQSWPVTALKWLALGFAYMQLLQLPLQAAILLIILRM